MNITSLIANFTVLVFLFPQQSLDCSSNSTIQRTVAVAVPWFQMVAASFTIVKHGTEFLDKEDEDDDFDG